MRTPVLGFKWHPKPSSLEVAIWLLIERITHMSVELDRLTDSVAVEHTVIDSGIVLLKQLAALLIAAKDDPVRILALAAEVDAKAAELSDAIVENTPVAP